MLAMWDRSAGREFQAAHREYADAAELQHLEATLRKEYARRARGGLERGEVHEISAQEDYLR
jgi:hypothetical protein